MKWFPSVAVAAACALLAAHSANGQEKLVWRNYEPMPRAFSQDSTGCSTRARQVTDGLAPSAFGAEFGKCVTRLGWQPMRSLAPVDGKHCEGTTVAGMERDSSLAPALREALTRRFRPDSAVPFDARYEFWATPAALIGDPVGDEPSLELAGLILATIDLVEKDLAKRFRMLSTGTTQRYLVTFRSRCVSEFPIGREATTELASRDLSPIFFEFQVEKAAMLEPGSPNPVYPSALRAAHSEGEVLAQFVVDTTGRAQPGSFKVLKSTHELFTAAVRTALPQMRFFPAEIGGRKVKQLVQQPFAFASER